MTGRPDDAETHDSLGGAIYDLARPEAAPAAFAGGLRLDPSDCAARVNHGATLCAIAGATQGLTAIGQAIARDPNRFEAHAKRAEALVDESRAAEALALAEAAIALAPQRFEGHAARARAFRALDRSDEALTALQAAIACEPDAATAHDACGVLLAELGRLAEARASFLTALRKNPRLARSHFGLVALGSVARAQVEAMERLIAEPEALGQADRLFLHYALAKAYDERGDFARAFAAVEAGAALRRGKAVCDEGEERLRVKRAAPEPASGFQGEGDATEAPVFVFGMPRSGTSLVEQILGSHPDVVALGETELFARQAESADGAGLAASYLARLPPRALTARRFVDKSLGNFLAIASIRRALPRAKLVHVRRNPLDSCLSCYFSLFSGQMPFAPDLGAIGRYYRGYADLMAAWRAELRPGAWYEIEYERLVCEPERETRALLAYCGLDWNSRCLAFHETVRPVRTASLVEVRRPLYASAVGRARNYAAFLEPLREGLETSPPVDIS